MNVTISLSVDSIIDQVLAETALRHHLGNDRPALLTTDRRPALRLMAHSAFALVCMALMPAITDCNIDTPQSADIMRLNLEMPATVNPAALRLMLEHAIACHILSEAYAGSDAGLSATFAGEYSSITAKARSSVTGPTLPATIRPCWL